MQSIPRNSPPSQLKTVQDIGQLELPGTFSSWKFAKTRVVDIDEELQPHNPNNEGDPRRTWLYIPERDTVYLSPNNAFHSDMYQ
jgi:hypothetical protein